MRPPPGWWIAGWCATRTPPRLGSVASPIAAIGPKPIRARRVSFATIVDTPMTGHEIRQKFLTFLPSAGTASFAVLRLFPANDPTLLFTNAGMNQFKDVFLGMEKRDYTPRGHLAEVRPRRRQAQRSRERRLHAPPSHVLRNARQLFLRRLLQSGSDRLRLGTAHQRIRPRTRTSFTSLSFAKMTKPKSSGRRSPAFRRTASSGSTKKTTSGRWATRAPAARARRFTTISVLEAAEPGTRA